MMVLRRLCAAAFAGALLVVLPAATGCGPSIPTGKTAAVVVGSMPAGATWKGVYFSELYGHLHIVQDGDKVKGRWLRPTKEKWGDLVGTVTGDVIHFEWTERINGDVGPAATKKGRGYFKYSRPAGDNVDDTIAGQIGRGLDEVGDPWDAIKQRNLEPDLSSIGGTGVSDVGGGDWDGANKDKGEPEPPASPPAP